MGVGVTCPNCRCNFAFSCSNCSSFETEIYESLELTNYFQTRSLFYLKCRICKTEYDFARCPDCRTKVIPEKPFVTGDRGQGIFKRCFIATACLDGNVKILNQLYAFRDEVLRKNRLGRLFIRYYYNFSPGLASRVQESYVLKVLAKYIIVYPVYYASRALMKIIASCKNK